MRHRRGWLWHSTGLPASPPWVAAAHHVAAVDRQWLLVCGVMTGWGLVFFGWRGLMQVAVTTMACLAVHLIVTLLRRPAEAGPDHALRSGLQPDSAKARELSDGKDRRGGLTLSRSKFSPAGSEGLMAVWLGMMTGLSLPLTQDFALPLVAGLMTGTVMQFVGRARRLRVHPLAVVMVLLWIVPLWGWWGQWGWVIQQASEPIEAVLRPSHVVRGDVFELVGGVNYEPWWQTRAAGLPDGVRRASFDDSLWRYRFELVTQRSWLVSMLSSGELPRFEEMLLGAVPGPVGASSPALVLVLGVYLMYRRLAWWPLPLWALVGALTTLAWMPVPGAPAETMTAATAEAVPVSAGEDGFPEARGQTPPGIVGVLPGARTWSTVARHLAALGPAAGLTLLGYLLLASAGPLVVMLHAPVTMPLSPRGRVVYGLVLGSVAMAAQWLIGVPQAPYLGLLVAGLLSRMLDNLHHSPFVR